MKNQLLIFQSRNLHVGVNDVFLFLTHFLVVHAPLLELQRGVCNFSSVYTHVSWNILWYFKFENGLIIAKIENKLSFLEMLVLLYYSVLGKHVGNQNCHESINISIAITDYSLWNFVLSKHVSINIWFWKVIGDSSKSCFDSLPCSITILVTSLWKLILSLNGKNFLAFVEWSHVKVFIQTDKRMRAMLNFSVFVVPLAVNKI